MKKSNRRLQLSTETLVTLTSRELGDANGGISIPTKDCTPSCLPKLAEKVIEKAAKTHLPNLPSGEVARRATYACC